jgi:hypothetical protein
MARTRHTAVLSLVAIGLLAAGCATVHPAAVRHPRVKVKEAAVVPSEYPTVPYGATLVATTDGAIPGASTPGGAINRLVPGSWYGYPSVLPVIATAPNWVEVRLAQRPNQTTTWVPAKDVTFSITPYQIVVNLTTEHLVVYQLGKEILDFPAGIGAPRLLHDHAGAGPQRRLRTVRPRDLGPLRHHHRLGRLG